MDIASCIGQVVGDDTTESAVDRDINATDIDFHLVPSGVVGAIVNIAVIIIFTIVLIELHINTLYTSSVDILEKNIGVEVTRVLGTLVVEGHHHEAVLGRRDGGVQVAGEVGSEPSHAAKVLLCEGGIGGSIGCQRC